MLGQILFLALPRWDQFGGENIRQGWVEKMKGRESPAKTSHIAISQYHILHTISQYHNNTISHIAHDITCGKDYSQQQQQQFNIAHVCEECILLCFVDHIKFGELLSRRPFYEARGFVTLPGLRIGCHLDFQRLAWPHIDVLYFFVNWVRWSSSWAINC